MIKKLIIIFTLFFSINSFATVTLWRADPFPAHYSSTETKACEYRAATLGTTFKSIFNNGVNDYCTFNANSTQSKVLSYNSTSAGFPNCDLFDDATQTCITPPPTCSHTAGQSAPDIFFSFGSSKTQCDGACQIQGDLPTNLASQYTSGNCVGTNGQRIYNGNGDTLVSGCYLIAHYTGVTCSTNDLSTAPTITAPTTAATCTQSGGLWNGTACTQGSTPSTTGSGGTGTTTGSTTTIGGSTTYNDTSNTTTNISTSSINQLADKLDTSSLNKEATQALIKSNLDQIKSDTSSIKDALTNGSNNDTSLSSQKSDFETAATNHGNAVKAIGDGGLDAHGFTWTWSPFVPVATCTPFSHTFSGYAVTMDYCGGVEKARDWAGWIFSILTGFALTSIVTGRKE